MWAITRPSLILDERIDSEDCELKVGRNINKISADGQGVTMQSSHISLD